MIINLIEALYDSTAPFPTDFLFFEQALEDIEYFAIAPQVYYLLHQNEKLELTPAFFQNHLKLLYNETLYKNIFIKKKTEQIFDTFDKSGIQVIPLKGVMFSEKYFGSIGARGTSDIDLLIHNHDLDKAAECIKSIGYTLEGKPIPSHFHCSFAKPLTGSPLPLTVELHWDILVENTSNFKIDEMWQQAKALKPYDCVKELSDYHTMYMICLHGWKHALDSLKYFLDIIQVIHVVKERLNYTLLLNDAAFHQTLKRMISTLSIVYREFPHLEKIKPFPLQRRSSLWWNYRAIRNKEFNSFMDYIRLVRYQCFDFDRIKHSLVASYHYLQSVLNR